MFQIFTLVLLRPQLYYYYIITTCPKVFPTTFSWDVTLGTVELNSIPYATHSFGWKIILLENPAMISTKEIAFVTNTTIRSTR